MSITLFYLCCYRPDTQSFPFHVLLDALVLSQKRQFCQCCCYFIGAVMTRHAVLLFLEISQPVKESIYSFRQILDV